MQVNAVGITWLFDYLIRSYPGLRPPPFFLEWYNPALAWLLLFEHKSQNLSRSKFTLCRTRADLTDNV